MNNDSGSELDVGSGDEDWEASITEDDWEEHDVFRLPTCPKPSCQGRGSNLHYSGGFSICLDCRSAISARGSVSGNAAFPYRTLRRENELRLLFVWPPRDQETKVHCTLIHCDVNDDLEYEAISYTWADESGDDTRNRTIFLDDMPLAITSSCEAALKRVRLQSAPRVLWVDAVCVNQDDMNERGHQVRLMPDIYSRAKRVLICLGDASEDHSRGFYYLSNLDPRDYYFRQEPDYLLWDLARQAVQNILARRYFSRVWILQEIALAKEAVVIYGKYDMPWKRFLHHILNSAEINGSRRFNFTMPLVLPKQRLPQALTFGSATIRGPSNLLELLDKARYSEARDPRDKVFAVFGMIRFASKFGFVADYKETVEEAYARIAVLLAARHGLIPIVLRAVRWERKQTLPPWVPDWTASNDWDDRKAITPIPILPDIENKEMELIGARLCDLATLIHAGFTLRIYTVGARVFPCIAATDLEIMYRALNLSPGSSLCCYALLPRENDPGCHDASTFQAELEACSRAPRTTLDAFLPKNPRSRLFPYLIFRAPTDQETLRFVGFYTIAGRSLDLDGWMRSRNNARAIMPFMSRSSLQSHGINIDRTSRSEYMSRFLANRLCESIDRHLSPASAAGSDNAQSAACREGEDPNTLWETVCNTLLDIEAWEEYKHPDLPPLSTLAQETELQSVGLSLARCLRMLRIAAQCKRPQRAVDHSQYGSLGGATAWLEAWADKELEGLDEILSTSIGGNLVRLIRAHPEWSERKPIGEDDHLGVFKPDISIEDFLGDEILEFQRLRLTLERENLHPPI